MNTPLDLLLSSVHEINVDQLDMANGGLIPTLPIPFPCPFPFPFPCPFPFPYPTF